MNLIETKTNRLKCKDCERDEPLEKFNFNVYLKNFKTSKKQFLA